MLALSLSASLWACHLDPGPTQHTSARTRTGEELLAMTTVPLTVSAVDLQVLGDQDGDGDAELALVTDGWNELYWMAGGPDGPSPEQEVDLGEDTRRYNPGQLASVNLDGDGSESLAVVWSQAWIGSDPGSWLAHYPHPQDAPSVERLDCIGYNRTQAMAAGDLDGDGSDELVIAGASQLAVGWEEGWQCLAEPDDSEGFGEEISSGGDIDGDGRDDLLVGDPVHSADGPSAGAVALYLGGLGLEAPQWIGAPEPADASFFGYSLDIVGDVDGDGFDDAVVGQFGVSEVGVHSGRAWLFYGGEGGLVRSERLDPPTATSGEAFGSLVRSAGDMDGDGHADFVVLGDSLYLYFGGPDGPAEPLGLSPGFNGRVVALDHGDMDGDGFDDLVVLDDWPLQLRIYAGGCRDEDGDGACTSTDCDDRDPDAFPGADELAGDGVDSDCDGLEDCYLDDDQDGYTAGPAQSADLDCAGMATAPSELPDCDDQDPSTHPSADELCDELDQDCDDRVDEDAADAQRWYTDQDGDGYGYGAGQLRCTGEALEGGDCDDSDPSVHPFAPETPGDGLDSDCDGEDGLSATETGRCGGCGGGGGGLWAFALLGLLRHRR